MIREQDVYCIGKIGKPHGVKGEVLFHFDDDVFDSADADYLVLEVDGLLVPFFIEEYRFRSDSTCIMKFSDIDDAERARELTGCRVFFPRSLTPEEDASWLSVVGFTLYDTHTQRVVGEIRGIDDTTINVLFEVCTPDGDGLLIPAADALIERIDADEERVVMAVPEGLL